MSAEAGTHVLRPESKSMSQRLGPELLDISHLTTGYPLYRAFKLDIFCELLGERRATSSGEIHQLLTFARLNFPQSLRAFHQVPFRKKKIYIGIFYNKKYHS